MGVMNRVADADRRMTHAAAAHRNDRIVRVLGFLSEGADQPPLVALSLLTLAGGAASGRPAVVRAGARMLLAHGIATGIKTVVKRAVDRTRPEKAIESGDERFEPGDTHEHDYNSFPSGHTAGAVAIAGAVATEWPRAAAPAMLTAATVAAVQIPQGKHYLGDVLAGAVVGWAGQAAAKVAVARGEAWLREWRG